MHYSRQRLTASLAYVTTLTYATTNDSYGVCTCAIKYNNEQYNNNTTILSCCVAAFLQYMQTLQQNTISSLQVCSAKRSDKLIVPGKRSRRQPLSAVLLQFYCTLYFVAYVRSALLCQQLDS